LERIVIEITRVGESGDVPLPDYASEGASGMDIRAFLKDSVELKPGDIRLIPTGLAVSMPAGYEAQIRPRSGLALRHGIGMVNSPGTIDSDYRGEIGLVMINWGTEPFTIHKGDRIAQMVITRVCPGILEEREHLDTTSRGNGGFGHTGRT
jgi:dUTP pyrophosphatase